MAAKKNIKVRKNYAHIHKLFAGVSLLAFLVVVISGLQAQASVFTIIIRSTIVILIIGIIGRILLRILATYEEMNSGKA
ncbi:MAG: hypothetical protein D6719_06810 [Candidatus Dadabacteria bacterium]|nr:MAG: hypothetical protein D6719_06810 [Candidatus Dadabacteria bacterium]